MQPYKRTFSICNPFNTLLIFFCYAPLDGARGFLRIMNGVLHHGKFHVIPITSEN